MARTEYELRCFCARKPMLGVYGVENGKLYVHVRIYKSNRIYGEIVVEGGTVRLRCRDCFRWHTVTIRQPGKAELTETKAPAFIVA